MASGMPRLSIRIDPHDAAFATDTRIDRDVLGLSIPASLDAPIRETRFGVFRV